MHVRISYVGNVECVACLINIGDIRTKRIALSHGTFKAHHYIINWAATDNKLYSIHI